MGAGLIAVFNDVFFVFCMRGNEVFVGSLFKLIVETLDKYFASAHEINQTLNVVRYPPQIVPPIAFVPACWDPRFKALAERLEQLRQKHEQGILISVDFLKELLDLAKDVVAAEQVSPPIEQEDRGKAALTDLFGDAKNGETPIMVERVVNDIDEIVRQVRFQD